VPKHHFNFYLHGNMEAEMTDKNKAALEALDRRIYDLLQASTDRREYENILKDAEIIRAALTSPAEQPQKPDEVWDGKIHNYHRESVLREIGFDVGMTDTPFQQHVISIEGMRIEHTNLLCAMNRIPHFIRKSATAQPEEVREAIEAITFAISVSSNSRIADNENALWSAGTSSKPRLTVKILKNIVAATQEVEALRKMVNRLSDDKISYITDNAALRILNSTLTARVSELETAKNVLTLDLAGSDLIKEKLQKRISELEKQGLGLSEAYALIYKKGDGVPYGESYHMTTSEHLTLLDALEPFSNRRGGKS
jgi:regulator of replication initiation timing